MSRPPRGAPWPTAATRPVVLLGWPVAHSLSPQLHNAAFAEQGHDLVYLALPTPPDELAQVVAALGTVGALGANVTVPHKQAVVALCDRITDEARTIGAVNTLVWDDDGLLGDNTDAAGLADALVADVDLRRDDPVVVLGTGGAARAAVVALGRLGAQLTVVGRRGEAADELAALGERTGAGHPRGVRLDDRAAVRDAVSSCRVAINATPLGLHGEPPPPPFDQLGNGQVAYDLVYGPEPTPFVTAARAGGASAYDGLGMLVAQAAASQRRWLGAAAPLATLRAAATAALASARSGT